MQQPGPEMAQGGPPEMGGGPDEAQMMDAIFNGLKGAAAFIRGKAESGNPAAQKAMGLFQQLVQAMQEMGSPQEEQPAPEQAAMGAPPGDERAVVALT